MHWLLNKPECEQCRLLYEDDPDGPPCATHCRPEVLPENEDAVRVFQQCRNQVIAGVGGVIDINILAVKMVMDLMGVCDQMRCLEDVGIMADEYYTILKERAKQKHADSED